MIPATTGHESVRSAAPPTSAAESPAQPSDTRAEAPRQPIDRRTHIAVAAFGALLGMAVLAWAVTAGSGVARFNDFYREAWPAYSTLMRGHVLGFVQLGPTYVGSLILRAPFAIIPAIWGGGERAVYFASALPCMFALAAFCTWLAAQPRRNGTIRPANRVSPVFWCVCNPITIIALFGGHPEEILGAVLCVGAVILAVRGRAEVAGLLVGLAVINKSWALVAVPVVFAVLPAARWRGLLAFAATVAAVLVPVTIARGQTGGGGGVAGGVTASQIGTIFNPPQLLWWFGPHAWVAQNARAGIVLVAILASLLYWWVRRGRDDAPAKALPDALLLLAFVFLARAALDPWNNLYYHLPFLFALIAYEASSGRMPALTILYTVLLLFTVPIGGVTHMSGDVRAASYAIVVVPTFAWMAAKIYLPPATWKRSLSQRSAATVASAMR